MNIDNITIDEYVSKVKLFREACNFEMNERGDNIFNFPFLLTFSDTVRSIRSYGCIMRCTNGKYLCVKRKHTVDYISLILGLFKIYHLPIIIKGIIQEERNKLMSCNNLFELWKDIRIDINDNNKLRYKSAVYIFNIIKPHLKSIFNLIPVDPDAEKNLWIFPKGRRNRDPSNSRMMEKCFDCACREFNEETYGISTENALIFHRVYNECFTATNGEIYNTIYYVLSVDIERKSVNDDISYDSNNIESVEEFKREDGIVDELDDLNKFLIRSSSITEDEEEDYERSEVDEDNYIETIEVKWMTIDEINNTFVQSKISLIQQIELDISASNH